jgi:PAS domain S-box-containing protein
LRGLRPLLEDEVVIERPDGEHVTVSDQIELIQDDEGCVVAALVVQIDVTARKETEQALATSEARLQLALEVSDFGTYDWDVTTNLVVRSANAARMLGVRPDGPLATRDEFLMRVHPDDRKRVSQADRDALAGVRPFDMEFRVIRADGEVRWLIDRARVFRGPDGRPLRMIGARMDVTERKRAEQQLAEMTRRKDQLTRLVDDLIDSARIAQGKVEMLCVPIDLRDAIADAVEVAAPLFEARRQQFQLAIPEVPMPMLADRSRLQQVFSNILVNATKYTDDHGVIALSVTATEYEARIVVRDNDRGVGADHLPWIFDMFMQASSETGLGIGLPVVRRLVEMHGGQLEARSDGAGRGSEFVVTLPLAAAGSAV